jgi:hypothetical protein
MTEFCVTVLRRPIEHRIRFRKVQEWVKPSTKGGPAGAVKEASGPGLGHRATMCPMALPTSRAARANAFSSLSMANPLGPVAIQVGTVAAVENTASSQGGTARTGGTSAVGQQYG